MEDHKFNANLKQLYPIKQQQQQQNTHIQHLKNYTKEKNVYMCVCATLGH